MEELKHEQSKISTRVDYTALHYVSASAVDPDKIQRLTENVKRYLMVSSETKAAWILQGVKTHFRTDPSKSIGEDRSKIQRMLDSFKEAARKVSKGEDMKPKELEVSGIVIYDDSDSDSGSEDHPSKKGFNPEVVQKWVFSIGSDTTFQSFSQREKQECLTRLAGAYGIKLQVEQKQKTIKPSKKADPTDYSLNHKIKDLNKQIASVAKGGRLPDDHPLLLQRNRLMVEKKQSVGSAAAASSSFQ